VSWIHSLPCSGDHKSIWSLSPQWDTYKKICLILARHRKAKKSLNILLHFRTAPIQIHNHAYSPVGIYSEKTRYKHKWHTLYFTQKQRTDNSDLVFKCYIYKNYSVIYFNNFTVCRISGVFAVRNECSFYSIQEQLNQDSPGKIRTVGKPRAHCSFPRRHTSVGRNRCQCHFFHHKSQMD
jgi:hypothetical protein